ncbi:MAG: hypothetical protein ACYDEA_03210 [Candidatus Dormibacteria bacterium]
MILGGIVGVLLAAAVIALGARVPVQERSATRVRAWFRAWPLPAWVGASVALALLISLPAGAGGASAGSVLVLLLVSMVVLLALAGAWSRARLRGLR